MKCGKKADRVNTGSHVFVIKYRLGHDLVRLVDKSAPDSRTASYTRADVWVETRTETN